MDKKLRGLVVLSGCGVRDGSEINEAVMASLSLEQRGVEVFYSAPDSAQGRVVDHRTGKALAEARNVLAESARIARGKISPLKAVTAEMFDLAVFPGGAGVGWNLSDFSSRGADCAVHPEVERIITEAHRQKRPMGFLCLAPILAARMIGNGVELTVGEDPAVAEAIRRMGAVHIKRAVNQTHIDPKNKIVSTPAYMLTESRKEAFAGIERLVEDLLGLI